MQLTALQSSKDALHITEFDKPLITKSFTKQIRQNTIPGIAAKT